MSNRTFIIPNISSWVQSSDANRNDPSVKWLLNACLLHSCQGDYGYQTFSLDLIQALMELGADMDFTYVRSFKYSFMIYFPLSIHIGRQ